VALDENAFVDAEPDQVEGFFHGHGAVLDARLEGLRFELLLTGDSTFVPSKKPFWQAEATFGTSLRLLPLVAHPRHAAL
jgi:hypothetical protein